MLLETVSVVAERELFKAVVTDAWRAMSKVASRKLTQWNTEHKIGMLYRRIGNVRKVKTIWQVDKAVDLASFYCDSHVLIKKRRKQIDQLSDFRLKGNILVEGIAGQGKSIFLRYLCAVALAQGQCIPLFIELRKVSNKESVLDRIYAELSNLGLTVDDSLFSVLAHSGKIVLFLDAFDEIPEDLKGSSLSEIEDLSLRFDNLQIIATSRPHHAIAMSSQFTNVKLDNLQKDEYKQVIHRLSAGDEWADHLISHIEKQAQHVRPLLCTPLMVTLLVLTYKSHKQLPGTLSGFYDSLFYTLLQRHDGTKPGFNRERGCELDDEQYRRVFEALCLLSKKNPELVFAYKDLYSLAEKALGECEFDASPDKYLQDILKITCLIVHDGDEHRFIHNTVQEYYAAAFISKKPDPWVRQFYKRMMDAHRHRQWREELFFLREIDTYRHNRYFMLHALLDFLGIKEEDLEQDLAPLSDDRIMAFTKPFAVNFPLETKGRHLNSLSVRNSFLFEDRFVDGFFQLDYTSVHEAVEAGTLTPKYEDRGREKLESIPVQDLFKAGLLVDEIRDHVQSRFETLLNTARQVKHQLDTAEQDDILEGLL